MVTRPSVKLPRRLIAAGLILALAGCAGPTRMAKSPSAIPAPAPVSWVEDPVSFPVTNMTVYGTFRHPVGQRRPVPAALLIAGSGPTDRNGDTPLIPGQVETLKNLAQALSDDGVASLRYDKLGTGQTGFGPYTDPAKVDMAAFQAEATAAFDFLAAQTAVDRNRLMVIGHSEGALYALLLATASAGMVAPVHALGLVEPASRRILDQVSEQAHAQADTAVQAGQLSVAQAAQSAAAIDAAIAQFRATGQVPPDEPPGLKPIINPANALFLSQEDAVDPAAVAATLPRGTPVLVTCSDADIQVTCQDADRLVSGLTSAGTRTDYVHLTRVDHALKEDTSRTPANYGQAFAFSAQLTAELASFVAANLTAP